jgi:hypothetical protein
MGLAAGGPQPACGPKQAVLAASIRHWSAATAPAPLPAGAGCVDAISSQIENKNQDQNTAFFEVRAGPTRPDGTGREVSDTAGQEAKPGRTARKGQATGQARRRTGPGLRPRLPRRRGETPWPWPRPGPFSQQAAPGPDGRGACRRRPGSRAAKILPCAQAAFEGVVFFRPAGRPGNRWEKAYHHTPEREGVPPPQGTFSTTLFTTSCP